MVRTTALLLGLIATAAAHAVPEDSPALQPASSLSGTVVDKAGRPIADAEVRIAPERAEDPSAKEKTRETRTDGSGRFRVTGLPMSSTYFLRVARSGFAPEVLPFTTPPAGPLPDLRLTLRPGGTATGILVDAAGQPAVGLEVDLVRTGFRTDPESYQGTSGPGGRFEIRDLPDGSFALRAKAPGDPFVELSKVEIPAEPGTTDLGRQILPQQIALDGRVVDYRGQPLEGVQVWTGAAAEQDLRRHRAAGPAAVTGADGRFTFRSLDPRRDLYFCRAGFEVVHVRSLFRPPDLSRIVLQPAVPPPVAKVSGRVVDAQGRPLAGARIWSGSFSPPGSFTCGYRAANLNPCKGDEDAPPPVPVTDAQGRVSFEVTMEGAASSSIDVWTREAGFLVEVREQVPLTAGQTTEVEIVLHRGAVLAGRILSPEGLPAAGAEVFTQGKRGSTRTVANAAGRYRLEGIEPGRGVLWVRHREHGEARRKIETALGKSRLDVILDGKGTREIRGRVLDPAGEPVPGAVVKLFYASGDSPPLYTGGDGSFVLEFRAGESSDGAYQVRAEKKGYRAAFLDLRLGNESVNGVELRLERGLAITGRLLGLERGQSVPGVGARRGNEVRHGEVRSDGTYRIESLDPGEWEVTVGGRPLINSGQVILDAGAGERVLDLELAPVHEVHGRVIGPDGEPVKGASIKFLRLPLSDDGSPPPPWGGYSRNDGTFSTIIPEGTYVVVADAPHRSYTRLDEPVEVDGPVAGLEIRLNPGVVLRGRILGLQPGQGEASLHLRNNSLPRIAKPAPDGTYAFSDLGPGDWEVLARLHQEKVERKATGRIRIRPGEPAATLDFDLSLGDLSLSLAFLSGDEPVIGELHLLRSDGTPLIEGPRLYDQDSFRYTSLRPGRYRLRIVDDLHDRQIEREIDLTSDQEVVIDLREER